MDPAKVIGKLKEQVRMEHKSRRNYPEVWHQISDNATNRFYHQNEIDSQLKGQLKLQASIGLLGIQTSYRKLEQSMQYVSPTFSMPGPRITAVPYNIIVIG
ncbi:uncharacterized protein [Drosophila pseudoobscura]|uniref:Uncharacterized protein isoform X2 n=1 Tax=Drosophila pseudoobscura pseudoobscura TaxID=46245 RepID=A0A0R3P645_DROPS|nr:uncharacterized protein LOC6899977 isoform X2 [Drosophila pseudoobscura]